MIRFSTRVGRHSWVSMPLWVVVVLLPLYWALVILEIEVRVMWWLLVGLVTGIAALLKTYHRRTATRVP
jgi:hypothetical protein